MTDPIKRLRECLLMASPNDGSIEYLSVHDIADEIEAAYIKLPVDADHVPIRPGDVIDYADMVSSVRFKVEAYGAVGGGLIPSNGTVTYVPHLCRHGKSETIESILQELVGRVKSCDSEGHKTIVEYAERIRDVIDYD